MLRTKFAWEPCQGTLVNRQSNGEQSKLSFATTVKLVHPVTGRECECVLQIQMERDFEFTDSKGLYWHKTWVIPRIVAHVSLGDKNFLPPSGLILQAYAVKANKQPFEYEDVRLAGKSSTPFIAGTAELTGLKYTSTSYNHQHARFHLILCCRIQAPGQEGVLCAYISSGHTVYSRKMIDKDKPQTQSPDHLFSSEMLTKTFVKKFRDGDEAGEPVDNSTTGLYRYWTASNIRNKCKHPLFLAVRFSTAVKLFSSKSRFESGSEDDMFHALLNAWTHSTQVPGEFDKREFVVALSSHPDLTPDMAKRLTDNFTSYRCGSVQYVEDETSVSLERYTPVDVDRFKEYFIAHASPGIKNSPPLNGDENPEKKRRLTSPRSSGLTDVEDLPPPALSALSALASNASSSSVAQGSESNVEAVPQTPEKSSKDDGIGRKFYMRFVGMHAHHRKILQEMCDLARKLEDDPSNLSHFDAYKTKFDQYLKTLCHHSHLEDTILFPALNERVPGVTEAYEYDHRKEEELIHKLVMVSRGVSVRDPKELARDVSCLSMINSQHMDKEEEHLLPYFIDKFDTSEIVGLLEKLKHCPKKLTSLRTWPMTFLCNRKEQSGSLDGGDDSPLCRKCLDAGYCLASNN